MSSVNWGPRVNPGMMQDYVPFRNIPRHYVRPGGTSASAIPKVWSNTSAVACQPFFSPPAKLHRVAQGNRSAIEYLGIPNNFQFANNTRNQGYEEKFPEAFHVQDGRSDSGQDGYRNESMSSVHREPICLHMWIIKPVPDTQSICVEGKKSLSEDHFWHSDVITERLDEKMVVTSTGSVYRLEGNMELMDAMAVGFSRPLVEAFWLGFPPDWKFLIANYYQKNSQPGPAMDTAESVHSDPDNDDVSFVDEVDLDDTVTDMSERASSAQSRERGPSPMADEVDGGDPEHQQQPLDEDEDEIVISEATVESQEEEGDDIVDIAVDLVEERGRRYTALAKPSQPKEGKDHVLSKWVIKFLADGKGIYVMGEKTNGSLWHSSAIEKRLGWKRVLSCTGSVYKLAGNMDRLLALSEDLPANVISSFTKGFPKEWQEVIQEHSETIRSRHLDAKREKSRSKSTASKAKKSKQKKETNSKNSTQKNEKNPGSTGKGKGKKQEESTPAQSNKKGKKSQMAKKSSSAKSKPPPSEEKEEKYESRQFVITPRGQLVDLSTLGRSRSGRLIKPPLHSYSRQAISLEGDNVVVTAPTAGAAQFLKQFEDQFQNLTRKIQPYYNPRQKDVDYSILNKTTSSNKTTLSNKTFSSKSSLGSTEHRKPGKGKKNSKTEALSDENDSIENRQQDILTGKGKRTSKIGAQSDHHNNHQDREGGKVKRTNKTRTQSDVQESTEDHSDILASKVKRTSKTSTRSDVNESTESNHQSHQAAKSKRNNKTRTQCDDDESNESYHRIRHMRRLPTDDSDDDSEIGLEEQVKDVLSKNKARRQSTASRKRRSTCYSQEVMENDDQTNDGRDREVLEYDETGESLERTLVNENNDNVSNDDVDDDDDDYCVGGRNLRRRSVRGSTGSQNNVRTKRGTTRRSCTEKLDEDETTETRCTRRSRSNSNSMTKKNKTEAAKQDQKEATEEVSVASKARGKSKKSVREDTTGDKSTDMDEDHWTKEEKECLYRACKAVPVGQANYWTRVAQLVGTKSADSCNTMFYQTEKAPVSTRKTKKQQKEKPRATQITANHGTLKRRQQLTDVLKTHNENYEDDLFDSTPYRNTRKRKMPVLSDLEDNLFEELARKQGHQRFETPKGDSQGHYPTDVRFASPEKTPGTQLNPEMSMTDQSFHADGYIHNVVKRLQTRRRSKGKSAKAEPAKENKPRSSESPPAISLFHNYLNEKRPEDHVDSEHEEDYYWNEEMADVSQG